MLLGEVATIAHVFARLLGVARETKRRSQHRQEGGKGGGRRASIVYAATPWSRDDAARAGQAPDASKDCNVAIAFMEVTTVKEDR